MRAPQSLSIIIVHLRLVGIIYPSFDFDHLYNCANYLKYMINVRNSILFSSHKNTEENCYTAQIRKKKISSPPLKKKIKNPQHTITHL